MAVEEISIVNYLKKSQKTLLEDWVKEQLSAITLRADLISEKELQQKSQEFLKLFVEAIKTGNYADFYTPEYMTLLDFLKQLSSDWASKGFTPSETATFIFSLKQPLFSILSKEAGENTNREFWAMTVLLDKLGLYTMEEYQNTRSEIITRQQQELLELSTPVAKLWEGIIILPLVGTLDSARTQQVMENLLQKIIETESVVAIIDITGIPTVDTLVAQHLIKTISAARLMGAECIISGIRPQIAQTVVHLGISLQNVITKATLADAVATALPKAGFTVARINK